MSSSIDLNTCMKTLAKMPEGFFFPQTLLLKAAESDYSSIFIWMTLFDAVHQVMTQKRSKGFFVKMFTAWSHFVSWLSLKSFLLFLQWHMLILQEQYFHSSETFLKVRTTQWEWENGLTRCIRAFVFFKAYHSTFFSLAPTQFSS